MRFIDFFAGVGGFRRGLEMAGHKCVGFCEWDKYAAMSYTSMHLATDEQREYLATLDLKKRQKEILKDEYRNGEWYSNDIRNVDARSVPEADCWCFGAPCQDFSIAGKRAGLDGDRSSLVREVFRILREMPEENRPEWLLYENVKGMFSSNQGFDYLEILLAMDELGYDIEWQLFNSKDWGVPQNRERVYTVGHLRRYGARKILPIEGADGENSISVERIENVNPSSRGMNDNVYDSYGLNPALTTNKGKGNKIAVPMFGIDKSRKNTKETSVANCLTAKEDRGVSAKQSEGTAVCIPILTPDRMNKRQNGRRFKEDGEPMFTLTSQDRHGVGAEVTPIQMSANIYSDCGEIAHCLNANDQRKVFGAKQDRTMVGVKIKEATKQGYALAHEGDAIDLKGYCSKTRGGAVKKQIARALDHNCNQGIFVQVSDELTVYAIWYEKYQCYIAIRKLTPRECFRLQGWTDLYFERAQLVNSDSQLYKQAGNGVTVNVVYEIGKRIPA